MLALAFTCEIYPQALSGTIVGTVNDQTGAVIPGAHVRLVNEGTQFMRTALTNANGQYVAYSVPTGGYTITVEHAGFQKLVRTGIRLTAADTLTVDLLLTLGSVEQTVEVTAETPNITRLGNVQCVQPGQFRFAELGHRQRNGGPDFLHGGSAHHATGAEA